MSSPLEPASIQPTSIQPNLIIKCPVDLSLAERQYYVSLLKFKQEFFGQSPLKASYETNKIWSRWIITQLVEQPPSSAVGYQIMSPCAPNAWKQLELELHAKSNQPQLVNFFLKWIRHRFPDQRPKLAPKATMHDDLLLIKLKQLPELPDIKVPSQLYRHLKRRFIRNKLTTNKQHLIDANREIWRTFFNYSFLEGLSLQWSIPDIIFQELSNIFKDRLVGEMFSSPLHNYLPNYWSLFQTDKYFRSQGDLLNRRFPRLFLPGVYECNPPFIEEIFIRVSRLILDQLIQASGHPDYELTFVFVMPGWLDSQAYIRFRDSSFKRYEIVLNKRSHSYYEPVTERNIQSSFNTHIIILSTLPTPFTTPNRDRLLSVWSAQDSQPHLQSINNTGSQWVS